MGVHELANRFERLSVHRAQRHARHPLGRLTERDVAVCETVWQLRFATAEQLAEIHWPSASIQACARRLLRLFEAGLLERMRPRAPTSGGSFPWTYYLGRDGYHLLAQHGCLDDRMPLRPPRVHDFGYVIHDLQVNAWVLAYRRMARDRLLGWWGQRTGVTAPPARSKHAAGADNWRPLHPDALLEISLDGMQTATLFVELDRTRRPDKNYDKLERYDAFLGEWFQQTDLKRLTGGAIVVFVCPDERVLSQFLAAADRRLRRTTTDGDAYPGRLRTFFTVEADIHRGIGTAWRVSATPGGTLRKSARLPGLPSTSANR